MSQPASPAPTTRNRLLSSLPEAELELLRPHLERVQLHLDQSIIEPHVPIRDIYFPLTALLSMVTVMKDGSAVECGSIGREGMSGVPVLLDAGETSMQTVVQIPGEAFRVRAATAKELFDRGGALRKMLNRYMHTVMVVSSQSTACNRLHRIEERLCRWLLMSSDGVGSDELNITHEYLAVMLGVRRAGVSEAAGRLQEKNLILYYRGNVQLLDRAGLEAAACECYRVVKAEYERLFA